MNDTFNDLQHQLDSLYGLPGVVLTLLFCLGLGYFLKMMRWPANRWIPLAVVIWGMIWNVLLRPPPASGMTVWQHYCRLIAVGFLIGLIACVLYDKVLKKLEDKWPWLREFLASPNGAESEKGGDTVHTEKMTIETMDKTSGGAASPPSGNKP